MTAHVGRLGGVCAVGVCERHRFKVSTSEKITEERPNRLQGSKEGVEEEDKEKALRVLSVTHLS